MSFRSRSLPIETSPSSSSFRERAQKIDKGRSELEKVAATGGAELFGGIIGGIPGIAKLAEETNPLIESLEEQARPEFLSSSGIEPAPEKGLANLFAALAKIPGIENFTPEKLRERFEETTEGKLKPESTLGKGITRGLGLAGQALGSGTTGLGNLARIAGGGLIGETLRQKGAPESIATGVEVLSPALIASLGKKFPMTGEETQLASLAKKIGMNDSQIAALLKSPKPQATFAKLASKGEKAQNLVSQMFDNLGNNYANLKATGREAGYIKGKPLDNLVKNWDKTLRDLMQTHKPSPDKEGAIKFIKDVVKDINNKGTTPEKLINLYQDINRTVNWNSWTGGKKQLAALKEPIKETLNKVAPELGKEFELTNKLYQKSINLAKLLKPSELENLLAHGHAGEIALGLATMNPGLLTKYLPFLGSRVISREVLFSPRFNQFRAKMMNAIKKNDKAAINTILRNFGDQIRKEFPEESKDFEIPEYS